MTKTMLRLVCAFSLIAAVVADTKGTGDFQVQDIEEDNVQERSLLLSGLGSGGSFLASAAQQSQCKDVVFFNVEITVSPGGLFATGCNVADQRSIAQLINQKLYDIGIENVGNVLADTTTVVAEVCLDANSKTATTTTAAAPTVYAPTTTPTSTAVTTTSAVTATAAVTTVANETTSAVEQASAIEIPSATTTIAATTKIVAPQTPSPTTTAPTFSPTKAPTRFPTKPPTSAPTPAPKPCFLWLCYSTPTGPPPTPAPTPLRSPTRTPTRAPTSAPTTALKSCFLGFCFGGRRRSLLLGTTISVGAFVYIGGGACRFCAKDNYDKRQLGLLDGLLQLNQWILSSLFLAFDTDVADPVARQLELDLEAELDWRFSCVGTMPMVTVTLNPVDSFKDVGKSLECVTAPIKDILGIP